MYWLLVELVRSLFKMVLIYRQMVVLFRLGLNHSFTNTFTHIKIPYNDYEYRRISIKNALTMKLSNSKYSRCLFL